MTTRLTLNELGLDQHQDESQARGQLRPGEEGQGEEGRGQRAARPHRQH